MSPRSSPRHAAGKPIDIPSASPKPKTLTKTATKIKKQTTEEVGTTTKKAKNIVPPTEEVTKKYEFCLFIDIIDGATYDANSEDINNLGLREDVKKLVAKFFVELKDMTKEL